MWRGKNTFTAEVTLLPALQEPGHSTIRLSVSGAKLAVTKAMKISVAAVLRVFEGYTLKALRHHSWFQRAVQIDVDSELGEGAA